MFAKFAKEVADALGWFACGCVGHESFHDGWGNGIAESIEHFPNESASSQGDD
jgi:hypothetical protein